MIYEVTQVGWLAPGWYIAGREHLGPYDTRQEAEEANPMSAAQTSVLADLQRLARKSASGTFVKFAALQHLDGRTLNALLRRGVIVPHQTLPGYRLSPQPQP